MVSLGQPLLLLFVVAPIKTNPYLIILIRSLYVVATSNAMRLPDTNNQPTLGEWVTLVLVH